MDRLNWAASRELKKFSRFGEILYEIEIPAHFLISTNQKEDKEPHHESIFIESYHETISMEPHHEFIFMEPHHESISMAENILKNPLQSSSHCFPLDLPEFGAYVDFKWLLFIDTMPCGWLIISSGLSLEFSSSFQKYVWEINVSL